MKHFGIFAVVTAFVTFSLLLAELMSETPAKAGPGAGGAYLSVSY